MHTFSFAHFEPELRIGGDQLNFFLNCFDLRMSLTVSSFPSSAVFGDRLFKLPSI